MLIVSKFGGSSVANSKQFQKVKNIITSNQDRKVVIVSALGKKDKEDSKITDLLYLLHAHLLYNVPYESIWNLIQDRYNKVKSDLNLNTNLDLEFEKLKKELNKSISVDYLVSRGEYLTALLMADYLGYNFVDAKDVVKFNYDGNVNHDLTYKKLSEAYTTYQKVVIPGFYGSLPDGNIKVFSRGGSDISGALVARALKATEYENWTDVSGVLITDPRIISDAKAIKEISYNELRELAYMGANVLHEETVFPVQQLNIPIHIKNTNKPEDYGTVISNDCSDNTQIITGISGKKNFTSFTITKKQNVNKTKTILAVTKILDKFKVNIEHMPSSIDSFSIIVNNNDIENRLYDIIGELNKLDEVENITVDNDIALLAVVGRNMVTKPGISGMIFGILGMNNINIKMIAQGSHEISIIMGISNADFEESIKAIYKHVVK